MSIMSVRERRMIRIKKEEILFIRGYNGVIGVGQSQNTKHIHGTPEGDSISLDEDDLIGRLSIRNRPKDKKAINALIQLLREMGLPHSPRRGHPTSKRLKMGISCNHKTDCNIPGEPTRTGTI